MGDQEQRAKLAVAKAKVTLQMAEQASGHMDEVERLECERQAMRDYQEAVDNFNQITQVRSAAAAGEGVPLVVDQLAAAPDGRNLFQHQQLLEQLAHVVMVLV